MCSVLGDNEGCVEQNDEVVCGTPRKDMVRGWKRLFYKAHRLKPIWFLSRACACESEKKSAVSAGWTDKDRKNVRATKCSVYILGRFHGNRYCLLSEIV